MSYVPEGPQVQSIDMTPIAGQVLWERYSLSTGELYVEPGCPLDMAQAVVYYAANSLPDLLCIGSKPEKPYGHGDIYRYGEMALKICKQLEPYHTDITAVQANVALGYGLKHIWQHRPFARRQYRFLTPAYQAAFIPYADTAVDVKPAWMMTYEAGNHPTTMNEYPPLTIRIGRYWRALKYCGIHPDTVDLDDHERNMLLRPGTGPDVTEVVKLDVHMIDPALRYPYR